MMWWRNETFGLAVGGACSYVSFFVRLPLLALA
jgi:hypothetical protein